MYKTTVQCFTPFAYADGADIIAKSNLDWGLVSIGVVVAVLCAELAFARYSRRDIRA